MKVIKLLLFTCLGFASFGELFAVPTPAYLSNPYFLTCKSKCRVINHGAWQELNMDCIWACIDYYEGKQEIHTFFDDALDFVDGNI